VSTFAYVEILSSDMCIYKVHVSSAVMRSPYACSLHQLVLCCKILFVVLWVIDRMDDSEISIIDSI